MDPALGTEARGWRRFLAAHPTGVVVGSLGLIAFLHYLTPQIRILPPVVTEFLGRHPLERTLFVLPMALATLAFGQHGGLFAVGAAVLLMLPRALWLSPHPHDALMETAAVALVGWVVMSVIESQEREKELRQKAVSRLNAANAISATVARSLELEQILADALDKVLEVTGLETGLIFLADPQTSELTLKAWRGVTEESAEELRRLVPVEGPWRRVVESGEPLVVQDVPADLRALRREGIRSKILVPLRSKDSVQGVLAVGTRAFRQTQTEELDLLTAIGNEIGVAVENARLHEEVGRKLQIQMRLNEVAERILSVLELDKIMPAVLRSAQELTGADGGGIALLEGEGAHGFCTFRFPSDPACGAVGIERAVEPEVVQTRRPVVADDYRAHPGAMPALVDAGVANLVAVPILCGEHLFGTLTLFHFKGSKRFVEGDVAVAVELGRQTGIAIENARLYQSMRFYVRQITRAQENERKRIARELHDETMQGLVVISRRLEGLSVLADRLPEAADRIAAVQELLKETARGVRRFAQDLRPPMLDHLGLVASVEALAGDLREKNGIEASVRVTGVPRRLEPEEELVLFRIVQEAMSNARRHSGATKVALHMAFETSHVRVSVSDNGCGFSVPARIDNLLCGGKLGLIGMSERARTLGGTLDIRSEPDHGSIITVEVPSQPHAETEEAAA